LRPKIRRYLAVAVIGVLRTLSAQQGPPPNRSRMLWNVPGMGQVFTVDEVKGLLVIR
jgi:hypothetical protein